MSDDAWSGPDHDAALDMAMDAVFDALEALERDLGDAAAIAGEMGLATDALDDAERSVAAIRDSLFGGDEDGPIMGADGGIV